MLMFVPATMLVTPVLLMVTPPVDADTLIAVPPVKLVTPVLAIVIEPEPLVTLMPVLPFIEDNQENIQSILSRAADSGAGYILASFGVTLRDRQRDWYYRHLERFFPGLRQRYEETYGERYGCAVPNAARLESLTSRFCSRAGIPRHMPFYAPPPQAVVQPGLF